MKIEREKDGEPDEDDDLLPLVGAHQEGRHSNGDEDCHDILVILVLGLGDNLAHQHDRNHLSEGQLTEGKDRKSKN